MLCIGLPSPCLVGMGKVVNDEDLLYKMKSNKKLSSSFGLISRTSVLGSRFCRLVECFVSRFLRFDVSMV